MSNSDLQLALRIKADLDEGRRALQELSGDVEAVGASAQGASQNLSAIGESAEQQAARIRVMVETSLQQQAAADAMGASIERSTTAVRESGSAWQQTAAAQSEAMAAYHGAERAAREKAEADARAAEAAAKAAAATEKEGQELQQLLGKIDPVIRKLDELDEMERQLRVARSSGRIDLETFDQFNAKLQEQRQRLSGTASAMGASVLSAKQYQQAMRQLPMQITDITTSLASGMPIWMVAVQQGGQIRDSFGGWRTAGRALLSTLNPLTVAITAATAALAAVSIAAYQGGQEAVRYREQLILTGNAAGTSADQLATMAAEIDGIAGTQRQAAAALTEVAGAGKFTAAQIREIATTAVLMENAVGKAVGATVEEFKRLADEPAAASAKLNEQYNYLTASVYEQIRALEDQGEQAAAAQLAFEALADAMQNRATEITGNLGLIESAWNGIKSAAAEAWDEMLSVGREQTLEEQLAALDQRGLNSGAVAASGVMLGPLGAAKELWDQISPQIQGATEAGAAQLEQERQRLRLQIQQRDQEAAWQAELARLNRASIAAQDAIAKVREQGLSRAEQKERAIAEYHANVEKVRAANPDSELISPDQIARDLASIEARFAERTKRTPTDKELKNQQQYVAGLERQAATLGMTAAEVREYELAEKGLAGALYERAAAALALIEQAEDKRQADADGKQLASIQAQLLASQGQQAAAAALQIEQQYGELIDRLMARGDHAGLQLIDQLINVEQAQAQLAELEQQIERVFAEQGRREQAIGTQQQAGLISEAGARQQILDLNRATADQIEQLLPKMRDLAAATGDPAAIERLKDMETRLVALRTTADEFTNALKSGLENGLQNALQGLATGTMDLQEAALSFITAISSSLANLATQQLAQMATDGLMGMFGGGGQAAGLTAGATAVTASAGALSAAGGTLVTGAAAIQTAAASLAAASTTQAATSAAGYTGAIGFATGGQVRGAGTGTSDSIPIWVSDTEFITRAAVVAQEGALPFLEDFNTRGMAALDDWAMRRWARHASGGLAGVPAPAFSTPGALSPRLAEPSAGATLQNSQNFYLIDDPQRIADVAFGSRQGQEAMFVAISRDPAKFRSVLGI